MNNEEMIKIRIIKSPYRGVDSSNLPAVAIAWKYEGVAGPLYMVDADFLPALSEKGMPPQATGHLAMMGWKCYEII